MIHTVYIEDEVRDHPRTRDILRRFPKAETISIQRYGEVFNRKNQNFRLQKIKPALIIARKHSGRVLPTPSGYGIGGEANYYFSHLYNCVYDCRYCFLQGMYRSANYVLFVNYEDFLTDIEACLNVHPEENVYFFSGYDCDSLALESVTGFAQDTLDFFRSRPRAWLELRTKSIQAKPLLDVEPFENCVVAFSLTPSETAKALDHKAPSIERRIRMMSHLAEHGWNIGLRFDPLIAGLGWKENYQRLFDTVFERISASKIHSVSYGPLRFPKQMHRDIIRLYPEEPLFAVRTEQVNGMVAYPKDVEDEMGDFCRSYLGRHLGDATFFQCTPEVR